MPRRLFSLLLLVGVGLVALSSVAGAAASSGISRSTASLVGPQAPVGSPKLAAGLDRERLAAALGGPRTPARNAKLATISDNYIYFTRPVSGTTSSASSDPNVFFEFDIDKNVDPPSSPEDYCFVKDPAGVDHVIKDDEECDELSDSSQGGSNPLGILDFTGFTSLATLAEGTYTFRVEIWENNNSNKSKSFSYRWNYDKTKPTINLTTVPQYSTDGHIVFNFTTDDGTKGSGVPADDTHVRCFLQNAAQVTILDQGCGTSPKRFDSMPEGVYRIGVAVTDSAGNTSDTKWAVTTTTVDKTKPQAQIIATLPPTITRNTTATLFFDTKDVQQDGVTPGSGLASTKCVLLKNGAPFLTDNACTSSKSYTGLGKGWYLFQVFVADKAGLNNTDPAANPSPGPYPSAQYSWNLDQDSPILDIPLTTTEYISVSSGVELPFTASDLAGLKPPSCWLDGGARIMAACSLDLLAPNLPLEYDGTALFNNLADGSYKLTVIVTDTLNNPNTTKQSLGTLVVDTVKPVAQFDPAPSQFYPKGDLKVFFKGSDAAPSSGGVRYTCVLSSSVLVVDSNCASPKTYNMTNDGTYTLTITAVDRAGNVSVPIKSSWTVDTSGPDDTQVLSPRLNDTPVFTDTVYSSSTIARIAFPPSAAPDFSRFECEMDGAGFVLCSSPQTYTLAEGWHTFKVRAVDTAGNVDQTPAGLAWLVDFTEPQIFINNGPGSPSNGSSAVIVFSGSDNWTKAADLRFSCRLDNLNWVPCNAPNVSTAMLGQSTLSEGQHTVFVRAEDQAGNISSVPASFAWTVDLTAPRTTITSAPAADTTQKNATFVFQGNDSPSPNTGIAFECRLDGGSWAPCSSPKSYSSLPDGVHTFQVRARDEAGNIDSQPPSMTWKIDNVVPLSSILQPQSNVLSSTVVLKFKSNDNPGAPAVAPGMLTIECRIDSGSWVVCGSLLGDNIATATYTVTGLLQGNHTFEIHARDQAGNLEGTPVKITKLIDATLPETTIVKGPTTPTTQTLAIFTYRGVDQGGGTPQLAECSLDNAAWAKCPGSFVPTGSYTATGVYTPTALAEGDHYLRVRIVDSVGNIDSSPAAYPWKVDNTAPKVVITRPTTDTGAISGFNAVFEFVGTDVSKNGAAGSGIVKYQCKFDQLEPPTDNPWEDCVSGKSYTNLVEGKKYTFRVKATDSVGLVSDVVALTFQPDATNPETKLTSPAQLTGPTNQTGITFTFTGTDNLATSDKLRFECSLDGTFVDCATGSPGSKSYASLADGPHTFQVRAKDQADNVDPSPETFTWTIDATAPNSVILTKPAEATQSRSATFTFNAEDGTGTGVKTVECKLDGGAWTVCLSTITLTDLAEGPHTFQVRGTDQLSNVEDTPASFSWVVDWTPPDTKITFGPDAQSTDLAPVFRFEALDGSLGSGLDIFECRIDSRPFENCSSGQNFPLSQVGPHTFEVRARDKALNIDPSPATYSWTVVAPNPGSKVFLPIAKKS